MSRNPSARLSLAAREQLDNLIFVVNCNLQRLDGPVRGNGKIIQELESLFRGAGWNCIKVIWGSDWDPLLASGPGRATASTHGGSGRWAIPEICRRVGRVYPRDFFGDSPELRAMVDDLSDEQIRKLNRGGHDPAEGVCGLLRRRATSRSTHRDPGPDDQGLRLGRSGRRQEHHAQAETTQRGGTAGVPRPVPDPAHGRRGRATRLSTSPRTAIPA